MTQSTTFDYTGWVLVEREVATHVRPPLYGRIVATDAISHYPELSALIHLGIQRYS
jgi:hypothetical protein